MDNFLFKRHPEKRISHKTLLKKPSWLRVKSPVSAKYLATLDLIKKNKITTICEEAGCPNIGECWEKGHAAVLIMGSICTRGCAFCDVATGKPLALDKKEDEKVANLVLNMKIKHLVITSVDRDDLLDGGVTHFAKVIAKVRQTSPKTTIEVLTPDFKGKGDSFKIVVNAQPDVFNHNIETVSKLYKSIKPGANYFYSLNLLNKVKAYDKTIFVKSGIMVGLGENKEEVLQVIDDIRAAGVDFLTIGQYLQPSIKHAPVKRFVSPEEFKSYKTYAINRGFLYVSSSPLTRSSYLADEDFLALKQQVLNSKIK